MRSNNPILTRSQAFTPTPQQQYGYAQGYGQQGGYGYYPQGQPQPYYSEPVAQTGRMTIDDVIAKTGFVLLVTFVAAAAAWFLLPPQFYTIALILSSLVGFVTALIVSLRRKISPAAVIFYAVVEGLFVGTFSVIVERYLVLPGIVTQAVIGTFLAAGATLAAYKYLGVRVQGRLAKVVTISIIAYVVLMLVNFALMLGGINLGITAIGSGAGWLAYAFSAIAVVLAVASLLMDFEYIENGIRSGAPESESWRGAFGLLVTMVWLYVNILRILSYFRD